MVATSRSTSKPGGPDRALPPARPAGRGGDSVLAAESASAEAREPNAAQAAARIARLFPEVYRRYHWANRLHVGELPVTRRALEVLQHLAASGPLTVGEQAEHLRLRRNSMSELLQRLEAKGLVARIRDERDERRVLVWLTDSGRDVVSRVGQVLAPDLIAQVMATLSPEERATVVRGFELLASADLANQPAAVLAAAETEERNQS
jgi:DNA-binding MarR family transcriptional regulator